MCIICLYIDFDEMVKAFEKSRKVIEKEGATPRFYTRYLVELEDFIVQVSLLFIFNSSLFILGSKYIKNANQ